MTVDYGFNNTLGESIPADTPHAVSVSLPTWGANVGYEEGRAEVVDRMTTGYPRFFVHRSIDRLATTIAAKYGSANEKALLVHTPAAAQRCKDFIVANAGTDGKETRILRFVPDLHKNQDDALFVLPSLSAVLFPAEHWPHAKAFWQHTGEGISSRRAEFCERALLEGRMVEQHATEEVARVKKGPRRYQKADTSLNGHTEPTVNGATEAQDGVQFLEERYGRNLSAKLAEQAKLAVRRRIAGSLSSDMELEEALKQPTDNDKIRAKDGFSEDDVYLFPGGMNAIFQTHQAMLKARGPMKSIMYGFPYIDTLKVLEKFGPGVQFYGHGRDEDLDDLEARLKNGERYLALFCEFPGNPLLKTPDLKRIRRLANEYSFAVVVDETISNFLNVALLQDADVIVSSLTKIFSGDCNVMAGAAILNPSSPFYNNLKPVYRAQYEDTMFAEDALYLERNSRDFVSRIARINDTSDAIAELLMSHVPHQVKAVNYPRYAPSRPNYDAYKVPGGGYGGLLSCTFHSVADAAAFYDALDTSKGPSLGTNFTLSSPYVLLAHFGELEWAAQYGCEESLVRFSIGLEDTEALKQTFTTALSKVPARV